MMDYLAGAVAISKLFQVQNWVAANSFFRRDENKKKKQVFKPPISMIDFSFS